MKQNSFPKEKVIAFFLARYKVTGFDPDSMAMDFLHTPPFKGILLPEFEKIVEDVRLLDLDIQDNDLEKSIRLFALLNLFILSVKKQLGYEYVSYKDKISVTMEKAICPPDDFFNFVGNNKMDIQESKVSSGLLYK